MSFEKNWYIIPYHIRKLPGMTLALLDFYETIFEFWNNGQVCFLSNKAIMERTGIKSITTIHDAFQYFEKHEVMKRLMKNNKRYVVQVNKVETDLESVDNSSENSTKSDRGTTPVGGGGTSVLVGGGTTGVAHNNNNLKANNLNKSSCPSDPEKEKARKASLKLQNEKKHDFAPKAPIADVESQSTSFRNIDPNAPLHPLAPWVQELLDKKLVNKGNAHEANQPIARTDVQSQVPQRTHAGAQGAQNAATG